MRSGDIGIQKSSIKIDEISYVPMYVMEKKKYITSNYEFYMNFSSNKLLRWRTRPEPFTSKEKFGPGRKSFGSMAWPKPQFIVQILGSDQVHRLIAHFGLTRNLVRPK